MIIMGRANSYRPRGLAVEHIGVTYRPSKENAKKGQMNGVISERPV